MQNGKIFHMQNVNSNIECKQFKTYSLLQPERSH